MALVLNSTPVIPWSRCHHGAGLHQFFYALGAPTPGLSLWARQLGSPLSNLRPRNQACRVLGGFKLVGVPNPPLNSDPACIVFRSFFSSRYLGSAHRLGAGAAG